MSIISKLFNSKKNNNSIPQVVKETPAITEPTQQIPSTPQTTNKIKKYKVAGVTRYIDNIMSLASENLDFDLSKKELIDAGYHNERIYQYDFYPVKVELIPEPDNPYDPKAIKVIIDTVHVGYIKSGSCAHIHKLLKEERIKKIDCVMNGGKYKYLGYDEDDEKYYLEKEDCPFYVHLNILEQ